MLAGLRLNLITPDWITGDNIYGSDRRLPLFPEEQHQAVVLGIKSDEALWCGFQQIRASALVSDIPATLGSG